MKNMMKGMLILTLFILLSGIAFAGTLKRQSGSSVAPNQQFNIVYSMTQADAEDFVAWHETISGGCTPNLIEDFMTRTAGDNLPVTKTKTINSPSSGSCIITGYYQFAGGQQINFQTQTVTIQSQTTTTTQPQTTTTTQAKTPPPSTCTNFWEDPKKNCEINQMVWWGLAGIVIVLIISRSGRR